MKKILAVVLVLALFAVGCGDSGGATEAGTSEATVTESVETTDATEAEASGKTYAIGISQLAEHPALDGARQGFIDGLKELGVDVTINYKNAQNDVPTAALIAEGFVADGVDLIYTIATPAAQAAAQVTESIPVLFSAVTDAEEANLVASNEAPGGNITGTSDAADINRQIALFKEIDPEIKTIGILYNTSEVNSEIQVNQVKEVAPEHGIEVIAVGINSVHDISQAMETLVTQIDGLYVPSDNLLASSISIVADILKDNKIPSVSAEASQVEGGTLLTEGISYYELGKQTAQMAKKILVDGVSPAEIPVEFAIVKEMTINKTTAEVIGIDVSQPVFEGAEFIE